MVTDHVCSSQPQVQESHLHIQRTVWSRGGLQPLSEGPFKTFTVTAGAARAQPVFFFFLTEPNQRLLTCVSMNTSKVVWMNPAVERSAALRGRPPLSKP